MSVATKLFVRHYIEMVVAMFLGMAVLGLPTEWALGAFGSSWSDLHHNAPALMLLAMAVIMTVPMVGWMVYRGHGWRPNAEMAASMFLPTFGVIGLLWGAVVTDPTALMTIEHVAMLPSMLGAMLLRRDKYSGHCLTRVEPRWRRERRRQAPASPSRWRSSYDRFNVRRTTVLARSGRLAPPHQPNTLK